MVYTQTVKFKRDTINKKGKATNTVRVIGLSVNSEFENNEELILISKKEFTQLENQESKIHELETQLSEANTKLENLENTRPETLPEPPRYVNKIMDLQEEINNRNELLINTQNTINSILTEVNTAKGTTQKNIISLISELQSQANIILNLLDELKRQQEGINSSIDNTSWFKWITSKNKFKIMLDTEKLNNLEAEVKEITSQDILKISNKIITPMELPADKLDLRELYIRIDSNTDKDIIVTPDKK